MRNIKSLISHLILVTFAVPGMAVFTKTAIAAVPAQWQSRGPGGGGALFAPSFSPHNANEIYLACDMSELFHTTDLGQSWQTTDFRQIQGNRESQVRFTNNPQILYALDYTSDLTRPSKSIDGGATWRQMYVNSADQNPAGAQTPKNRSYRGIGLEDTSCRWITWSDANNMFASYSDIRGARSTDAGAAWSFNFTGQSYNSTYQSVKHPTTSTLYVATSSAHDIYQSTYLTDARLDTATGAVLYSTDKGATWVQLHNFSHPVIGLALDPNNQNRMYATVIHSGVGGVYVSSDIQNGAASTWTKLANPARTEGHPFNIHVLNDGTLVSTYSGRRNSSGAFTASSGVFASTDGGNTWTDRSDPGMRYWTKDIVIDPHDPSQNTWFTCVFSGWGGPPNGLGGLYKTTNRGASWTRVIALDRVGSCTISPTDQNEMYLTTETEGLWRTANLRSASPAFTQVAEYPFRQPERVFFNPNNASEIWVTSFGGGIRVGTTASCSYSIAPTENFFTEAGGAGAINVSSASGCNWTAATAAGWIAITSGANGAGSGAVNYTVAANATGAARKATISVAGQIFTVTQDGGVSADCSYSISPLSKTFSSSAATATITMMAGPRCAWQATANVNWISFVSAASGVGNGVITYSVTANTSGARRKGKITIAGLTYNIKQKP